MSKIEEKRLPSVEMPWLKWHPEGAREKSIAPQEQCTMYKYIERAFLEHGDKYPAMVYFGKKIQRSEVLRKVDLWARMFRGMGVGPEDRVVISIPFIPEAAYILFALNRIGAWPVMLNLGSAPEALKKGAEGAKFGIVADAVEEQMAHVFRNNPAFEYVIYLSIATDMPVPTRQIVKLKSGCATRKLLREAKNYITSADALKRWGGFDGQIDAEYKPGRPAIVTSSGGTSSAGYAKQIMDTNEAVIAMFRQALESDLKYRFQPGTSCLTSLPPFVSTSIFVLFLAPLFRNMTCYIEPRVDAKTITKDVLKFKPSVCLIPGRAWIYFFTQVERKIAVCKTPDLSRFVMPIMGGEGVIPEDFRWMNSLMRKCGSPTGLVSGYGMSEVFSLLTADMREPYASDDDTAPVISVGQPMPGTNVAILDEDGNELTYGQRGEVCAKATTLMRGYYNDEENTAKALEGGWYHSGDLGYVSEDGLLYIYGRMADNFKREDGSLFCPVDLEIRMNEDKEVHCTMVNNMAKEGEKPCLVAHVVLYHSCTDRETVIRRLDESVKDILPEGVRIEGYKIHRHVFRMSNVCKTDRNSYRAELTGYVRPDAGRMVDVSFN